MCIPIDVGSVVLFAKRKCDRRTGARIGVVKSKINNHQLVIVLEGEEIIVTQRRCLVIRSK
jgi:hypothetical protein